MYCKNCGREQQGNERFCAQCGTPYESAQQPNATVIPNIPNIPVTGSAPVPPPIPQATAVTPAMSGNPVEHRCPNCGANYTNTTNCEYCGSLLVRFVEKGIDLSKTSYTDDSQTLPGLTAELKRNLNLQKEYPKESVVTDLHWVRKDDCAALGVLRTGHCNWLDHRSIELGEGNNGLIVTVCFSTYVEDGYEKFNKEQENSLQKFKRLPSFSLFTSHNCMYFDQNGDKRYCRGYAIDFGKDAEGAARLISEILIKVYDLTLNTPFDIFTEVGDDIDKARKAWDEAHGFSYEENEDIDDDEEYVSDDNDDNNEDNGTNWWYWVVGLAALYFLFNLFKFLN